MRVIIVDNKPKIEGLPKDQNAIFFAEVDDVIGYVVVYGPEICIPKDKKDKSGFAELDHAKMYIGKLGRRMRFIRIKHGHKLAQGGGWVETFLGRNFRFSVSSRMESTYCGRKIKEVFIM